MYVVEFFILERVVDGKVISVSTRVLSRAEAEEYVTVAASQGETYHAVQCEAKRPSPVGKPPTKAISFFPTAS